MGIGSLFCPRRRPVDHGDIDLAVVSYGMLKGLPNSTKRHRGGIYNLCDDALLLIFLELLRDEDPSDRTAVLCKLTEVCHWWRSVIYTANAFLWDELQLVGHRVNDTTLLSLGKALGKNHTLPRHITLRSCRRVTSDALYKMLSSIGDDLETIDITACGGVFPHSLRTGSRSPLSPSKQLAHVGVHGGWEGGDITAFLEPIAATLRSFDLKNCYQHSGHEISEVVSLCPNLRTLSLNHCYRVEDAALISIVQHCQHLEDLDLTGLRHLTMRSLHQVFSDLPNLKSVNLTGCQLRAEANVRHISCPNLEHLQLDFTRNVDDAFLKVLSVPQLKSLSLWNCKAVTSSGITSVIRQCPHLEQLMLQGCEGLRPMGWPTHKKLAVLNFVNVPPQTFSPMLARLPSLKHLTVSEVRARPWPRNQLDFETQLRERAKASSNFEIEFVPSIGFD